MSAAWELSGRYATDVFTDEAVRIIQGHDASPLGPPLFLYLAHLAVHAGNRGKLLEAPQQEINRLKHIGDPNRRTYGGDDTGVPLHGLSMRSRVSSSRTASGQTVGSTQALFFRGILHNRLTPDPSSEDSATLHPVSTSLHVSTIISSKSKTIMDLVPRLKPGGPGGPGPPSDKLEGSLSLWGKIAGAQSLSLICM